MNTSSETSLLNHNFYASWEIFTSVCMCATRMPSTCGSQIYRYRELYIQGSCWELTRFTEKAVSMQYLRLNSRAMEVISCYGALTLKPLHWLTSLGWSLCYMWAPGPSSLTLVPNTGNVNSGSLHCTSTISPTEPPTPKKISHFQRIS